jgi:hypothetical protein
MKETMCFLDENGLIILDVVFPLEYGITWDNIWYK